MARPSMAGQRREEILDALEKCILEKGIQATSLENIAEKAEMKRTILRHYIGNRDDIICALSARWTAKYSQEWQDVIAWLPAKNRTAALIDSMFSIRAGDMISSTIIGEALFSEAKRLDAIKQDQQKSMAEFLQHFSDALSQDFPEASPERIELVALTCYSNYLMYESLLPLNLVDEIHKLKQATTLLLELF
ncbi:TetR/AcrR family transcriptional regulator [Thalassotalea euphylliae]|uniref:TetR/AcrR family transcriptional regulator n=1 Tax=Thalassotalea euphylliae TaxID=1655234 RepID=UPI0036403F04